MSFQKWSILIETDGVEDMMAFMKKYADGGLHIPMDEVKGIMICDEPEVK